MKNNLIFNKNIFDLIFLLTKRKILARYRGSFLGLFWAIINPILMLAIYTFVFSFILNLKWGIEENESKSSFAIILFCGLIFFTVTICKIYCNQLTNEK